MLAKMKTFLRVLATLCCFLLGMTLVGGAPQPGNIDPATRDASAMSTVPPRNPERASRPQVARDDEDDGEEEEDEED